MDSIIVINEHGIIVSLNIKCANLFGYEESELMGEYLNYPRDLTQHRLRTVALRPQCVRHHANPIQAAAQRVSAHTNRELPVVVTL